MFFFRCRYLIFCKERPLERPTIFPGTKLFDVFVKSVPDASRTLFTWWTLFGRSPRRFLRGEDAFFHKCASKLKFTGRIKPFLSWTQRADMIYLALHAGFANGDIFLAAEVFDIPKRSIRSWLNNNTCYSNWIPFAKSLVPLNNSHKALNGYPPPPR